MPFEFARAAATLEKLCAFALLPGEPNRPIVDFAGALLTEAGFDVEILPERQNGERANLYAVAGDRQKPGICFCGHTDVVPVEGQTWDSDPFRLRESGGKLHARGTADMKGFLAVVLSMLDDLASHAHVRPVHIVLTYDEESGCHGAREIEDFLAGHIAPQTVCIVGEPTGLVPVVGHKGIMGFGVRVKGSEGHAALIADKANAIHYAADLIRFCLAQAGEYAAKPPARGYGTPFSTIQVGLIQGGIARNMVARECGFEFEFRHLPRDSSSRFRNRLSGYVEHDLLPQMLINCPDASVEIDILSDVPAFENTNRDGLRAQLTKSLGNDAVTHWDGVTEAGYYKRAGLDTIVWGPGNISEAHQPNEFVSKHDLQRCGMVIGRLMADGPH